MNKKENIYRNLRILKYSLFNIHIGNGGGIGVFGHLNKLLCFTSGQTHTSRFQKKYLKHPAVINSINENDFIHHLVEVLDLAKVAREQ